jgi:hypothetical protein
LNSLTAEFWRAQRSTEEFNRVWALRNSASSRTLR